MASVGWDRPVRRIYRTLSGGPKFDDALAGTLATGPGDRLMVLDSSRTDPPWGRFSYLAFDPPWVLSMDRTGRIRLAGRRPEFAPPFALKSDPNIGSRLADSRSALDVLRQALSAVRLDARAAPADNRFVGGWAGYLGYEFGSALENVPPAADDDLALPRMQWAFYDAVACFEHATGRWELSALALSDERAAQERLDQLEERLRRVEGRGSKDEGSYQERPQSDLRPSTFALRPLPSARCNLTRTDYERAVARAKDYIAAGDIYQVNLSQRFSWPVPDDPCEPGRLFARLRRTHPAWYSALLAWLDDAGDVQAICSASPELFLAVHGRKVVTRPIKGTCPRGSDEASDRRAVAALLGSAKDAAELAMIVDLERNDLGRVCRFGSVRVVEPRAVETHAHVHHTAATIEGELADGRDVVDLLAATFPGGSITGAPKIRAMQIIAELEPTARSVYTGAIGYLGVDGSAMLNIAIRTILVAGGQAHLQVGGGIVADSSPAGEYQETLDKAQGLAEAIGEIIEPAPAGGAGAADR